MPSTFPPQDYPVKGNETSDESSHEPTYGNEPTYRIQDDANNQSDSIVDTETLPKPQPVTSFAPVTRIRMHGEGREIQNTRDKRHATRHE